MVQRTIEIPERILKELRPRVEARRLEMEKERGHPVTFEEAFVDRLEDGVAFYEKVFGPIKTAES